MKIAVVGGGISGLTAAFFLSKKGHQVVLFEKEEVLGGLASGFKSPKWSWPLERYYHHYFESDQEVKSLAKELKIKHKLFFKKPKTSVFMDGMIFRFDNPQSILSFPKLSLTDKLRTGLTSLFLKVNPFWKPLENISAVSFVQKTMGRKVYSIIWGPLFESKFGNFARQIPASWFWTRIKKRSFSLGYFEGGTETLINSLRDAIEKNKGKLMLNKAVNEIKKNKKIFELTVDGKKYKETFDRVAVTASPTVLAQIAPQLSAQEKGRLRETKSLGSLCLVLEIKESFLTDGTYWLNISDKSFPFVAVVEHTNYIDKKNYNGNSLLYIGGYYPTGHRLLRKDKDKILAEFLPHLKKINPAFDPKSSLVNSWLFKDSYSQPIVSLNYSQNLPLIKTSIKGLFWGSLHHVYPQDRGVNYAIALGKQIANEIVRS